MKKITFIILTLLLSHFMYAQQGEIIHQEFNPATHYTFVAGPYQPEVKIPIDLDLNGVNDFEFQLREDLHDNEMRMQFQTGPNISPWSLGCTRLVSEGDTLSNLIWGNSYCSIYTSGVHWIGVRWQRDEGYCYGWVMVSMECYDLSYNGFPREMEFFIHGMAYCTQPGFSLQVGQTNFDWHLAVYDEKVSLFSINPNPTNGQVIIAGKDMKSAAIYNAFGQCVATAEIKGDQHMVDLSGQPAGVYFVNVTDQNGKRCVKKVVKR